MSDAAAMVAALDELVRADGARFELTEPAGDDTVLRVRLVLTTGACAECVLPRPMLEAIAGDRLRQMFPGGPGVEIDDPREHS